uniref:Uncharacterized protein n=1 Tax=Anguilla anguilla TaxID=7936 RepID=A0A0E9XY13_ANGAN
MLLWILLNSAVMSELGPRSQPNAWWASASLPWAMRYRGDFGMKQSSTSMMRLGTSPATASHRHGNTRPRA